MPSPTRREGTPRGISLAQEAPRSFGTTLLLGVGKVSVLYAQEQGTTSATSETAPAKDNSSSRTDVPPDADAISKTSDGSRIGLVGKFVRDQREIWTSPAKLRFSDTEWLVPLSGVTAGLFVTDRDFSKHLSQNPTTISHYKTLSNAGVAGLFWGGGGNWGRGAVEPHLGRAEGRFPSCQQ